MKYLTLTLISRDEQLGGKIGKICKIKKQKYTYKIHNTNLYFDR